MLDGVDRQEDRGAPRGPPHARAQFREQRVVGLGGAPGARARARTRREGTRPSLCRLGQRAEQLVHDPQGEGLFGGGRRGGEHDHALFAGDSLGPAQE